MLYYLFDYLDQHFDLAGAGLFKYISFRAGASIVMSLLIAMIFGKRFIRLLQRQQVGESIRDLGLEGQLEKAGTPTMGGVIIISCILIPTLLFAKLDNIYVILLIVSTVWMGLIGFLDDYLKVLKKNKEGLQGKFKIVGQVGLGLIVGLTLYFHQDVTVREYHNHREANMVTEETVHEFNDATSHHDDVQSTVTTIPFLKDNEFDYKNVLSFLSVDLTWLVYVLVVIFIVTAVSNGANITLSLIHI